MFWNFNQLERAALADNLPAIVEALIACQSAQCFETPGWVTRKSRDWIIKLLRETRLNGQTGQKYLKECRQNMIHARRYDKVQEVLEQQPEIEHQVTTMEAIVRERSKRPRHGLKDPKPQLKERQEYVKAIGSSLQSACEASARLLAIEGLRPVSAAAILRSYKRVETYELDGPYYMPKSVPVLAVFRILGICKSKSKLGDFERALLGNRYSKLRPSDQNSGPVTVAESFRTSTNPPPTSLTFPWALEEPKVSRSVMESREHAFEYVVRAGNVLAVVSGLDHYNRNGGLAPPWLLQAGAWWIIALLKRQSSAGERSILTECAQRLIDCERYQWIERKRRDRLEMSTAARRDCERTGLGQRATSDRMRSLGLQFAGSLDNAIRETLSDLRGTPLEADFETAKKAFNRVKAAPHLPREHWVPLESIARLLDLPLINELQKVGNEYPRIAQNC